MSHICRESKLGVDVGRCRMGRGAGRRSVRGHGRCGRRAVLLAAARAGDRGVVAAQAAGGALPASDAHGTPH